MKRLQASFVLILIIASTCFFSIVRTFDFSGHARGDNDPAQPADGGTVNVDGAWTVRTMLEYHNCTIVLKNGGNLLIDTDGKLIFHNVTLSIDSSESYLGIGIYSGGAFYIHDNDNNPITLEDATEIAGEHRYYFRVFSGAELVMRNSALSNCGPSGSDEPIEYQGLFIESDNVIIEQSTISDGYCNGLIVNNSSPTINNNSIYNNNGDGIECISASPVLTNNTIRDNSVYGIHCREFSMPLISSNIVISSLSNAIKCDTNSSPTITDNIIQGMGDYGGGIGISDSNPTITNNIISNGSTGISCSGSSALVQNNIITNCRSGGIFCSSSSNCSIIGNRITSYNQRGIECNYASPIIRQNIIAGGLEGIYCIYNSYPDIEKNIISDNTNWAIRCTGYQDNHPQPNIDNNVISGVVRTYPYPPIGSGISCEQGNANITHNTLSDCIYGIYCSNSSITHNIVTRCYIGITSIDYPPRSTINYNSIYFNKNYGVASIGHFTLPIVSLNARANYWGHGGAAKENTTPPADAYDDPQYNLIDTNYSLGAPPAGVGSNTLYCSITNISYLDSGIVNCIDLNVTDSVVRGFVKVDVYANSIISSIQTVALYFRDESGSELHCGNDTLGANGWSVIFDSTRFEDGLYYVVMKAVDDSGAAIYASELIRVELQNANIHITNVSIFNPPRIFTPGYDQRFANVSVYLNNTGARNGTALVSLEGLPGHIGRQMRSVLVPANSTANVSFLIPIVRYNVNVGWYPTNLPNKTLPFEVVVKSPFGSIHDSVNSTIQFNYGPKFEIIYFNATQYSEDGDGDTEFESCESYHFSISVKNTGDETVTVKSIKIYELVGEGFWWSEEYNESGLIAHGWNSTVMAPNAVRGSSDLYMPAWGLSGAPVDFIGNYSIFAEVCYEVNNETHYTHSVTRAEQTVTAFNKSFTPITLENGPMGIYVYGLMGNKALAILYNGGEVYYEYKTQGAAETSSAFEWYNAIPPSSKAFVEIDNARAGLNYNFDVAYQWSTWLNELDGLLICIPGPVPVQTIVMCVIDVMLDIGNSPATATPLDIFMMILEDEDFQNRIIDEIMNRVRDFAIETAAETIFKSVPGLDQIIQAYELGKWFGTNLLAEHYVDTAVNILDPVGCYTVNAAAVEIMKFAGASEITAGGTASIEIIVNNTGYTKYYGNYSIPASAALNNITFSAIAQVTVALNGSKESNITMTGDVSIEIALKGTDALLFASLALDTSIAREIIAPYLTQVDNISSKLNGDCILIEASGEMPSNSFDKLRKWYICYSEQNVTACLESQGDYGQIINNTTVLNMSFGPRFGIALNHTSLNLIFPEGTIQFTETPEKLNLTSDILHELPRAVTLYVDNVTHNSTTLSWTKNTDTDFAKYEIYQSTSSGTLGSLIHTITTQSTTSYTITGLSAGATYYFKVRVVDGGGLYADSTQVTATTTSAPQEGISKALSGNIMPILAAIIIIVVVVVVLFVIRKKKT